MGDVPDPDAPWMRIAAYAMTYDAYERWVGNLSLLSEVLRPIHVEYERTGQLPPDLGEDLLRAWLFTLVRQSRFIGVMKGGDVVVDDYRSPAIELILTRLRELTDAPKSVGKVEKDKR